jgi:cytochrome c oxidase subunit II
LLCNKICGASHYNMQMKIVVDTPSDFKKWISEQTKFGPKWKEANTPEVVAEAPLQEVAVLGSTVVDSTATVLK